MSDRRLLIALMAPTLSAITMLAMFVVAIPTIRAEFGLSEDVAAWLQVAYAMPFMMFMPLYGRLAVGLGARRLLLTGLGLFILGTTSLLFIDRLLLIFIARAVQGAGAAGINPLSMAIIMHHAPQQRRGSMLGTWNSIGPISGMAGPLIGGLLIDTFGWRSIFGFALVVALIAFKLAWKGIPFDEGKPENAGREMLRSFDWPGVILFNLSIVVFVFFLSSRPITGYLALTDWRLGLTALGLIIIFIIIQQQRRNPFINLSIFRVRNFTFASSCVSIRMALMGGISFVVPLYVTDLYGFSATAAGAVITLHSFALLITMRLGGRLIDRYRSRTQIIIGLGLESLAMLIFILITEDTSLMVITTAISIHGLGAGLCLAALHLYALGQLPAGEASTGAGLYSMVRFAGSMFGQAVGGVILYAGIKHYGVTASGYSPVFLFYFILSLAGAGAAFGLTRKL